MTAIRKRLGDFLAILFLVVVAAAVAVYVLHNQRLRFPLIQEKTLQVNAEFSTAQAVTPGQGQTVRVAGVQIGDIGKVTLNQGRAIVRMDIDPQYKNGFVRQDATALLRPKTGLKDMFIELNPGTQRAPPAKDGFTIPVNNTLPDVNPDEVLASLDADTRNYLKLLINGAGEGLNGRGGDLQNVFERFEPTYRDLGRFTGALSQRRENLRHLVHSLQVLNTELASSGRDISELVDTSAVVFRTLASEQQNIRAALRGFPPALRQTTTTLGKVERFAGVLRPTADRLRPAVRSIAPANEATKSLALETTPIVRDQIRPFVREARPLVRNLVQPSEELADSTSDLRGTFRQLNKWFDVLGYNPGGRQGAAHDRRDEGWLFQVAWISHQTENLFTMDDANGPYRPIFLTMTCDTARKIVQNVGRQAAAAFPTPPDATFLETLATAIQQLQAAGASRAFALFGLNFGGILATPLCTPNPFVPPGTPIPGIPGPIPLSVTKDGKIQNDEKQNKQEQGSQTQGGDQNQGGGDQNQGGGDQNQGGGDQNQGGGDQPVGLKAPANQSTQSTQTNQTTTPGKP
jgi:phospholipid/cholesterol/gamma-HCH transport system substrate-binding protein